MQSDGVTQGEQFDKAEELLCAVMRGGWTIAANHHFSYWDSLIVAFALESGCTELWSEDLQTGRVVEGRLTIVNPLS